MLYFVFLRDKWNLYEVSQGVWSLDLIPDTLLMIFKLDGHTKYDSEDGGFGIVNIKFKEIYASMNIIFIYFIIIFRIGLYNCYIF